MFILTLIYKTLIGPLELFFEVVFSLAYRLIGDVSLSIVALSLAMNFLVLPLYRRADALQEEERDRALAMKPWTDHIKKAFKGDERFMMLQTYNRQNGYKQTDVLKSSLSLLLEIPFFIAAFRFLSGLELLNGVQLGPIADLGAPDALLQIGGMSINVLPIIMTVINVVSAAIYLKGFPPSSKFQTYGIAAIFLVLLYNSPAGLVFYWTLNNVFSLVKNIFYKLPKTNLANNNQTLTSRLLSRLNIPKATPKDGYTFLLGCLLLAVLVGLFIPLTVIQSSHAEFVNASNYRSPLWSAIESFALAFGTFVIWFGVFYWIAPPKGKTVFGFLVFACAGAAIVNYLFFGTSYGNLSPDLQFDNNPVISKKAIAANLAVLACLALVFFHIWRTHKNIARIAYVSFSIAVVTMSLVSMVTIHTELQPLKESFSRSRNDPVKNAPEDTPIIKLSKTGKNVVVIMLDRAIPDFVPYIMEEKPELQKAFAGFTAYNNTLSYGPFTNIATPALYGGSEYRPKQINERSNQPLAEKQNEALKVMPSIFLGQGYDVTVFDPTYAGYEWIPNLSIYDDLPGVRAHITMDGSIKTKRYKMDSTEEKNIRKRSRNFFCYGLFKTTPLALQPFIYQMGGYNSAEITTQIRNSNTSAEGLPDIFLNSYAVLEELPEMTEISDASKGSFLMMSNDTTHNPGLLQEPEYVPKYIVDNSEYDQKHPIRENGQGETLDFTDDSNEYLPELILHYQANMASLIKIGAWCDYLREQGVYDNTRIILVSDHSLYQLSGKDTTFNVYSQYKKTNVECDIHYFNCLLMVKDFGSTDFTYDDSFMTNADTPVLAFKGIIDKPINPFTGKTVTSDYKNEPLQYTLFTDEWGIDTNNGNVFIPGQWFSVHDDVRNKDNWVYLYEE